MPGWLLLAAGLAAPAVWWWFQGETFLAQRAPIGGEVLVVDGWIGPDGLEAAAAEYFRGGYAWIVATGGLSRGRGDQRRWSYTSEAVAAFVRAGIRSDRIIAAAPPDVRTGRTLASAQAVQAALARRGYQAPTLDVFTLGAHARRSRLVYLRVFSGPARIGAIAWTPPDYATEPWWRSTERVDELVKETLGFVVELARSSLPRGGPPVRPALLPARP